MTTRRGPNRTREELDYIAEHYPNPEIRIEEIADHIGVNPASVRSSATYLGLKRPLPGGRPNWHDAWQLYLKGYSKKYISEELYSSPKSISYAIQQMETMIPSQRNKTWQKRGEV